ncbi:glycosyltransferase [Pseudorhodobacter ferrugineus]|uniref:glycosyltransferase n=2 Tax=Pseudorhodobacter ferrugineus TaxID=77008 RepID=UPI0018CE1985|nr:glycosyltransferase [Pseudorhodobacter ferrugineus]
MLGRLLALAAIALTIWCVLFVQALLEPPRMNSHGQTNTVATVGRQTANAAAPDTHRVKVQRAAYARQSGQFNDHRPVGPPQSDGCAAQPNFSATAIASAANAGRTTVFALLPADDLNGYLSFARNCHRVNVLVPEMFEITAKDFVVKPLKIDDEMVQIIEPILRDPSKRPVLMPSIAIAFNANLGDFLTRLLDADARKTLVDQMLAAVQRRKAQGLCVSMDFGASVDLRGLTSLLHEMKARFSEAGFATCIVVAEDGMLWHNQKIVAASDVVIVQMFRTVWAGSKPAALAPDHKFAAVAQDIVASVGNTKLVMALGSHAVDWISGQALPETLAIPTAYKRIADANAALEFAEPSLNNYSSFVDDDGKRHQIWMLDAVSTHNQMLDLATAGITNIAIANLGLEDPATWQVLDVANPKSREAIEALERIKLDDFITYEGAGPFYRWRQGAQTGLRQLGQALETGKVTSQALVRMPRPTVMERHGATSDLRIALTFDDGPNETATTAVLDALQDAEVPATFFIVGSAALKSPDLLRRMVDEGHLIGSHTFLHPHLERVQPWQINLELNATQKLIEGQTGRNVRLFRPPYIRGSGPMTAQEASLFPMLADQGYVVAGSSIVPPDWSGLSAQGIVDYAMNGLRNGHGNIMLLHDGRAEGMHTVAAIPLLIATLRSEGYQIVSLADLLGSTSEALMPVAGKTGAAFSSVSFGAITTVLQALFVLFWVFILAGVARAITYLVLAHKRVPQSPTHMRSLPSVTVVIPAYNESLVIENCVQKALAANYPDLRVIVVDDGSTDDTLGVLQAAYQGHPQVTILTQANQGKWQALNTAYERIDTEIAVCIDADTQICADAIRHLVAPFANPRIGAVAGTILVGNKRNLLTKLQALEYFTMQNIGRRAQEYINGIVVVPGALGAWRVEAVRDLGLLSNETLTEDTDLTMWMLRGGYQVAYADEATAYTEAPSDVRSLLKQRLRWNVGILQSLWKHRYAFAEKRSLRLISVLDLAFFGFALPLLAPLVDLMILAILANVIIAQISGAMPDFSGLTTAIVMGYVILPLVDLVTTLAAFRFDRREKLTLLWVVPFQNLFFRQILYISVCRAVFASLTGRLARWDKLRRFGMAVHRRRAS